MGIFTTGLSVPVRAIIDQNGQPMVWVHGSYGATPVPVEILSQDSEYAIVQPMQSDALTVGQSVMLF